MVTETLDDLRIPIHSVTGRPKEQGSAIEKTIKKGYGLPSIQMTDLVGVRVITYYAKDVDQVVPRLRASLTVHPDPRKSPDKRVELDVREFGYSSVHLVVQATGGQLTRYPALRDRWFEVQVRGILEHSWAEIEHDIVYKSGTARERGLVRRFSAMAAVLEVVNSSFEELRVAQREVAALHAANYSAGRGFDMPLDAARLAALMHSLLPRSPGWHEGPDSPGTTQHMAARMVDALAFAGVRNGDDLRARITANQVGDDVAEYATAASLASDDVSHVTRLLLMLGRQDPSLLGDCFPWEAGDAYLAAVLGL
ncbi:MAG TPA: hypothetical protein VIK13_14010 [Candidatus Limnocylindrales bacterium]